MHAARARSDLKAEALSRSPSPRWCRRRAARQRYPVSPVGLSVARNSRSWTRSSREQYLLLVVGFLRQLLDLHLKRTLRRVAGALGGWVGGATQKLGVQVARFCAGGDA